MTTDEIIDYYAGLLIMQYNGQPNAAATVAAYVAQAIADQIYAQVRDGFNFAISPVGPVDGSPVGLQMDAVASYVGARRVIYGLAFDRLFFSLPVYGDGDADTAPGFALYGQDPILDYWLTYVIAEQPIYALTDEQLYRLTQFKALEQSMLESVEDVDDLLFEFFGSNVAVFEDSPMLLTYIDLISDTDPLFGIVVASNSLPRPAGVQVHIVRSETLTEFFGFQFYDSSINPVFVGFGLYGSPQAGSFVRYA